jgi:hypothetical protein
VIGIHEYENPTPTRDASGGNLRYFAEEDGLFQKSFSDGFILRWIVKNSNPFRKIGGVETEHSRCALLT